MLCYSTVFRALPLYALQPTLTYLSSINLSAQSLIRKGIDIDKEVVHREVAPAFPDSKGRWVALESHPMYFSYIIRIIFNITENMIRQIGYNNIQFRVKIFRSALKERSKEAELPL